MRRVVFVLIAVLILTAVITRPSVAVQTIALVSVASLHRPVNVSFTHEGIILSYRVNDSATVLAKLEPNGTVGPFDNRFSGVQEVYLAEANGSAEFTPGDLFLCSGDSIYVLSGGGGSPRPFATPSPGTTVGYISFDTTGYWGHLLYALTDNGGVWAVDSKGTSKLVTNLGNGLKPEGIAVAPADFGAYARDLLIALENSHNLVAISQSATADHIQLVTFPNQAPERVIVVVPSMDLLLAKYDQGVIARIARGSLANYVGLPLVITEGENLQSGSISVLEATGSNVTSVTLFSDATHPHFEGTAFIPPTYLTSPGTSNVSSVSTKVSTGPSGGVGQWYAAFLNSYYGYLVVGVIGVVVAASLTIAYRKVHRALSF